MSEGYGHLVEATVDAFVEAAMDPSRWGAAMDVLAQQSGSHGAVLLPVNGRTSSFPMSPVLAPATETYIKEGWATRDARDALQKTMVNQRIVVDLDYISPEEMRRHPYYREFLEPFGLRWFAGMRVQTATEDRVLSIQRTIEQGPFVAADLRALAPLTTRLPKAMLLAEALGHARVEAALGAFEASGTAVLLLNRHGAVVRMNASAERIVSRDFQVLQGRIAATDVPAARRLERAVHQLINGRLIEAETAVAFIRPDRLPLLAYPLKLPSLALDVLAPCQAVIILRDPEIDRRLNPAALVHAFGFTATEARLAVMLTTGKGLRQIADEFGSSYETIRSQLRAVFGKTGTNSQPQLVALISRLAQE